MARALVESALTTRGARSALKVGFYWRNLDRGIHLGYHKSRRGGRWLVRWYLQAAKSYRRIELGDADDFAHEQTLDYHAAVEAARTAVDLARRKAAADAEGPTLTVGYAIEQYLALRNARKSASEEREIKADASSTLNKHVLRDKKLCALRLDELTESKLIDWREGLDPALKGTTRRRILNDFKAGLNTMLRKERRRLPTDLETIIKMGLAAEDIGIVHNEVARENQILDDAIVRQIVAKGFEADSDIGRMLLCLAATGARFSQIRRMKVRDAQLSLKRLLVPHSRKGRNKSAGYSPIRIGPDVIEALELVIAGRRADEPLLERWRLKQTGPGVWVRDRRGAWTSSSELTRPWGVICEQLGLEKIVPYALRHSSIVRGIASGLPVRLVAAMHDTSVAMIEKHYSRWIVDGLEEMAARAIIPIYPVAA
jgi:integrase